jgi:hypothetical protein
MKVRDLRKALEGVDDDLDVKMLVVAKNGTAAIDAGNAAVFTRGSDGGSDFLVCDVRYLRDAVFVPREAMALGKPS